MAIPPDFLSSTFVDPEQLNANKIYTRILQPINTFLAWARTVKMPYTNNATATTAASGFATITHGLGAVPSVVTISGRTNHIYSINRTFPYSSTQFQIFVGLPGSGNPLVSGTYDIDYVCWP